MHMSFEWNGRKANKWIEISKMVRRRLNKACKEVWGKKDGEQVTEPAYCIFMFCLISKN